MSFLSKFSQNIKSKVSGYQISQDQEYDNLQQKYKQKRANCDAIDTHMKDLRRHMEGMHKALVALNEDFAKEFDNNSPVRLPIGQIHQIFQEAQKTAFEKFQADVQYQIVGPLEKRKSGLDAIKPVLERRESAKIKYDNANNKYLGTTAPGKNQDVGKIRYAKMELNTAIDVYNSASFRAKRDMYSLVESQDSNAMVSSMCDSIGHYSANLANTLTKLAAISEQIKQIPVQVPAYQGGQTIVPPADPVPQQPQQPQQPTYNQPQGQPQQLVQIPPQYDSEWYYLDAQMQQHGPIDYPTMRQMYMSGQLAVTQQVFGGNLSNWSPLSVADNGNLLGSLS